MNMLDVDEKTENWTLFLDYFNATAKHHPEPTKEDIEECWLKTSKFLESSQKKSLPEFPGYSSLDEVTDSAIAFLRDLKRNRLHPENRDLLQHFTTFLILQRCIVSLPEELLAIIIEFASMETPSMGAGVKPTVLSHVSRRFRNRTLAMPILWTSISNAMNENLLELYLSRSGNEDLGVIVYLSPTKSKIPDEFAHSHNRWRFLTVIAGAEHLSIEWIPVFGEILNSYRNVTFPHLRRMRLLYMTPFDMLEDPEAELNEEDVAIGNLHDEYVHFYSTWNMPCLEDFTTCNVVPRIPEGGLSTLRKFNQAFLQHPCPDWKGLQHFLATAQSLTELSLSFGFSSPENWISSGPVVLPCLKVFELNFGIKAENDEVYELLCDLRMPVLTKVTLELDLEDPEELGTRIESFFAESNQRESVRTLIIKTDTHSKPPKTPRVLDIPFHFMRDIQHLTLETPSASPPPVFDDDVEAFPRLRSLTLRKCDQYDISFVKAVVDQLIEDNIWDDFEMLNVDTCRGIEKGKLLEIVPEEKVIYKLSSKTEEEIVTEKLMQQLLSDDIDYDSDSSD